MNSPEHRPLMVEVHAECDDRRRNYEERCGDDKDLIHSYLSICTIAEKFRAKESSNRAIARNQSSINKRTAAAPGLQQRVASVEDGQMAANEEMAARVAALESRHFRSGGPHGGGTTPPYQGSLVSGSTAAGGMMESMRHLQPVKSPPGPPSQSGSDSDTFVGRDGLMRHSSKGLPEVRITDAVEALKDRFLGKNKILSLRYVKIPPGVEAWEHLSKCRIDPWMVERLYDGGNCDAAIKDALAYINPAAPYGGEGEPSRPTYSARDNEDAEERRWQ